MNKLASKVQLVALLTVIAVAIFFRFFMIRDYITFLGDEGRDMIIMRNMFVQRDITFLGPTASVGGFYLGPIYYWMAAPFLAISGFDPVGPAYFVAILGVLTVYFLFRFLRDAAGFWPAILAAGLYSIAPLVVRYSRSSWNPNPLPFFSLLLMYFLYLGITKKKFLFFVLAGACFGVAIQLHYLSIILLAIAALIIAVNTNFKKWPAIAASSIAGSLITISPFLLFEIKNHFPNFKTILEFTTRGSTIGFKTTDIVFILSNTGNIFLEELTGVRRTIYTKLAFWILAAGGVFGLIKNWKSEKKLAFSTALIWLLGGLAGLRFYSGSIYDYYYGFIFPAPFFLAGMIFSLAWSKIHLRIGAIGICLVIAIVFLQNGFYKTPPNRQLQQTANIADFIIEKSNGQPFNFALISSGNSDHAYRYFLEIKKTKVTNLEDLITDQLIIICESSPCPSPLGHPLWEIAAFGRGEIAGEWDLPQYNFKLYRLIHWPGEPSPAGKPAPKGL